MSNSAIDAFNKGEAVKVSSGNAPVYTKKELKVKTVFIEKSQFKANDGSDQFQYKIEVTDKDGNLMYTWQPCFINKDGSLASPAMPGNEKYAASPIWEIKESAKERMGEEKYNARVKKYSDKEGNRMWKEFLEGLVFEMDVKEGEKKDGGTYSILMTEKQKRREEKNREEYKNSEAAKLADEVDAGIKADSKIDADNLPF